jgi:hypothetical protein
MGLPCQDLGDYTPENILAERIGAKVLRQKNRLDVHEEQKES